MGICANLVRIKYPCTTLAHAFTWGLHVFPI